MKYEIRALGVGDVLDHAISVTRDNLWLFTKIMLVLFLPFNLATNFLINSTAARARFEAEFGPSPEDAPAADGRALGGPAAIRQASAAMVIAGMAVGGIVFLVNGLIVTPLTNAAIIYAIGNRYLDQPISMGTAYRRAIRVYFPLLGTLILVGLATGLGMMCIVPGVLFALWFSVSSQVVVLEGLSSTSAMGRSRQLVRGNMLTAFLLWIVVTAIGGSIGLIPRFLPVVTLSTAIETVLQTVLVAFFSAVWVVFYFSCRAKAEHFDLAMLADAVGAETEAAGPEVSPGPAG